MGKTIFYEGETECDAKHCDEHDAATCPLRKVDGPLQSSHVDPIQRVFAEHGPANERNCDWWRTMAEPWRSLADALAIR